MCTPLAPKSLQDIANLEFENTEWIQTPCLSFVVQILSTAYQNHVVYQSISPLLFVYLGGYSPCPKI